MHGPTARLKKALLVLSAMSVLALPAAAPAMQSHVSTTRASHHPFLVHINADASSPYNCNISTWYSAHASCTGRSAVSGHSYGFNQTTISVSWCSVAEEGNCFISGVGHVGGHKLPSGNYSRWMKVCQGVAVGDCGDWLLGAVVMPNGPFSVVAGSIGGQAVHPDSGDQARINTVGGPLHLVVTYKDRISNGAGKPAAYGYTIGLIGSLNY